MAKIKITLSKGPQGVQGPQGPQGPLGPAGPQGIQGQPGVDGTIIDNINDIDNVGLDLNTANLVGTNIEGLGLLSPKSNRYLTWDPVDNIIKLSEDTPGTYLITGASGSPSPGNQFVNPIFASTNGGNVSNVFAASGVISVNQSSQIPSSVNLYVNGNARFNGAIQVGDVNGVSYSLPSADGTAGQLLQTDGAGAVTFVDFSGSPWTTSGSDIYYNTGNVGIGTTTPAAKLDVEGNVRFLLGSQSPTYALNITGVGSNTHSIGGGNSLTLGYAIVNHTGSQNLASGSANKYISIGGSVSGSGSRLYVKGSTSDDTAKAFNVFDSSSSELFVVRNDGNVGIGTATPAEALDVVGQLQLKDSTAGGNILINAGTSAITTGTKNVAIGNGTGQYVLGSSSVAIGDGASAGGAYNIAIGKDSGKLSSSYSHNVFLGRNAGRGAAWIVQSGIAIGYNAMGATNGGVHSIAMGQESLYQTQFQDGNHIALGFRAMRVSNGDNNVAIGSNSMSTIVGSNNVAVGVNSGGVYNSTRTYSDNVAIGASAGQQNNGGANVLVGREAGKGNASTFTNTVAVGYQALTALTTGTGNTAVGYQAGATLTTSTDNTFIGYLAGATVQTNTKRSVAIGREALNSATTYKSETVAIGDYAGNTSGQGNAYVGYKAGNQNTGGNYNTGIGWNALKGFGTTYSTALGYSAGTNSNGDYNVLLGASAGSSYNSSFSNTVAVGYQALTALTTDRKSVV